MADGGDGSIDIIGGKLDLSSINMRTVDPLGREITDQYYYSHDVAFIELAGASGLALLAEEERNPIQTSTFGTGLLIKDALNRGFTKIYLFIGGSATCDAGIGIASALGFDFVQSDDTVLHPTGGNLINIHAIKKKHNNFNFNSIEIVVLCDVTNGMHGPDGASFVYSPQKGASPQDVTLLDDGLKKYAKILESTTQKNLAEVPGMGAAGAVAASLVGLMNARIENGFEALSEMLHLEEAIKNADFVITGEGKIDKTSFRGKVVGNVIAMCDKHNTPYGLVGGILEKLPDIKSNFILHESIIEIAGELQTSMSSPKIYLRKIGKNIANYLLTQPMH